MEVDVTVSARRNLLLRLRLILSHIILIVWSASGQGWRAVPLNDLGVGFWTSGSCVLLLRGGLLVGNGLGFCLGVLLRLCVSGHRG